MSFKAGSATRVINCEIGDDLAGQYHRRLCEGIRDNLEANFVYLGNDQEQVLLVSLDLAGIFEKDYVRGVCSAVEVASGIPARNVILTSTHTHDGPDTLGLLPDSPKNERYLESLRGWIVEGAKEAASSSRPARVGWALGRAHVGYNRRLCWKDGTHSMYGDATRPDFTGLEGPDDPSHSVLVVSDEEGKYLALLHNNCCHSTCIESSMTASADFPGEARRLIREALATEVPVLYLQGASGDVAPWNMLKVPWNYDRNRRLHEVGGTVAAETLRLLHEVDVVEDPVLRHQFEDVEVSVRLPSQEIVDRAREVVAQGEEAAGRLGLVSPQSFVDCSSILRLHEQFNDHPFETLAVHAIRIGDFAIVTIPCELYCQFGLDMKRRSPAAITVVAQLTDGFSGYCPTIPGIMGGGYSAGLIYWCRLEPYAGYKLVEASARLVNQLWH